MTDLDTQDIRQSYIPCQCAQSGQHLLWLWAALDEVDRLRAAESDPNVVRVDLNDENLLYRLAEAIEQPIQYLGYVGDNAYLELPQEQVQLYAIRHALRQPEDTP